MATLLGRPSVGCIGANQRLSRHSRLPAIKRVVFARSSNDSKVVREYREDEDKIVVPGGSEVQQTDGGLYVDSDKPVRPRQDNLSREMKDRLRKEYYSLGGAEQKAAFSPRAPVVAVLKLAEEEEAGFSSNSLSERESSSSGASSSGKGSSKWVIDENELLASTAEHRLFTFGSMALMGLGFSEALANVHSGSDGSVVAAALLAAYVLSDLGTGVYHWGVDNYGDGNTPVFGRQIAAFQGHHQRPWTITQREFCNNVHQVFKPAAAPAAAIAAISPLLPLSLQAFMPSFLFFVCMSQQFHAWSHMKKSQLPWYIVAAQDANLLISRKAHGAHHKPNFEGNYCIVNGWWNPLLDSTGFFRWLEFRVRDATGVEPRCWYAPEHDWAEQTAPEKA